MKDTALYHSFNARYLSFEEVSNFFIPNQQYTDLHEANHTLLLGPRGCGKTTLLKMLTPNAVNYWNNKNEEKIELPFFGIYIPADNQWKKELDILKKELQFSPDFSRKISETIVSLNVIKSIAQTFNSILRNFNREDADFLTLQRNLCTDLINVFEIEKPISPDFYSIELAIRLRVKKINELISKVKLTKEINFRDLPSYYFSNFFDLATTSIFVFEKNLKNTSLFSNINFRWALCFDELELAPEWLQDNLLNQLRSRSDQNILFKLTSTPIIKNLNGDLNFSASDRNDYSIIRAWTYNDRGFKKWREFSGRLAKSKIESALGSNADPEEIFGEFKWSKVVEEMPFYDKDISDKDIVETDSWKGEFAKGKMMWQLTRNLALNDSPFRAFLGKNEISFHNPEPKFEKQMGPIFRKMMPIIIFRSQFISDGRMRARKNVPLYFGADLLYNICDGNPRLLTGLLDELLKEGLLNPKKELADIYWQSSIIYKISNDYLKLISSHPDSNVFLLQRTINIASIIKQIGVYFHNTFIKDPFTINPNSSFVVDSDMNPQIVDLVDLGVKLGAFVHLDPNDAISNDGIKNKYFRLSYILHPAFRLPIRDYPAIKLSKILFKKNSSILNSDLFSDTYETIVK